MKPYLAGMWAWMAVAAPLLAQKEQPFDFNQAESPRLPAPAWVKVIDQGDRDAKLKGYRTPEGVQLAIAADHPLVANPVGMTFGDDGSLYVIEWTPDGETKETTETITYKDGRKRDLPVLKKSVKDVVKRLRDTNGDGVFDEAKVVLEDELPASILLHDGWIYLSGRGTVRRYRQSQKDGPYDVKEVIAQGFSSLANQQVSGLALGNDGWLYISSGDQDNYAEGSDGSKATVLRTGAIFRCRPDGSKLEVYAIGFRNPYREVAFDLGFQMFAIDNDSPDPGKFRGCRLMQVPEGGDFGWRRFPSGPADPYRAAVWGERPGKLTPMLKTGAGAPAGLLIYEENAFPESFRGLLYYPDVLRQSVRAYQVRPMGSTYEATHEFEFLKSDDPLFRPCQMVAGPDGAMYVCDWRGNPAQPSQQPDGKQGRIYRLSWAGTKEQPALAPRGLDAWSSIASSSVDELRERMGAEPRGDRLRAQRELARRGGDEIRTKLVGDLENSELNTTRRVAALGALNSLWNRDVKLACLRIVEGAGSPDLRRLAAEALALNATAGDIEVHAALLRSLADQNLAARRAIALAMGQIANPDAADALTSAFKFNRDNDPFLADGYLRAIERLGKPGIDKLIELALSGDAKDFDRVIDAFRALRTKAAADAIPELLKYPHLTMPQRTQLLETYRHFLTEPPVALTPVADYLLARGDEPPLVKMTGLQTLALGDQLKGERLEELATALLDESNSEVRQPVIELLRLGQVKRAAHKLASKLPADAILILRALHELGDATTAAEVLKVAASAKETPAVRIEALRTLAKLDRLQGAELAKTFLADRILAESWQRLAERDPELAKLLVETKK